MSSTQKGEFIIRSWGLKGLNHGPSNSIVQCSTSKLQRTGGQGKLKVLVYRADIII